MIDVAGGNGQLSLALARRGVHCHLIEPRSVGKLLQKAAPEMNVVVELEATVANRLNCSTAPPAAVSESADAGTSDIVDYAEAEEVEEEHEEDVEQEEKEEEEAEEEAGTVPTLEMPAMVAATRESQESAALSRPMVPAPCLSLGSVRHWVSHFGPELIHQWKNLPGGSPLDGCGCVVGLHPDAATEAIVDAALQYALPLAVVPCCVFQSLFPFRMLVDPTKAAEG